MNSWGIKKIRNHCEAEHPTDKLDLTKVIWQYLDFNNTNETRNLIWKFMTRDLTKITRENNQEWKLAAVGPRSSFAALTYIVTKKSKITPLQIMKLVEIVKAWIGANYFAPSKSFTHLCGEFCEPQCSRRVRQSTFLESCADLIIERTAEIPLQSLQEFFMLCFELKMYLTCERVGSSFKSLLDVQAFKLFASASARCRTLIFMKFSAELKESVKKVIQHQQPMLVDKIDYSSKDVFDMVCEALGSSTPQECRVIRAAIGFDKHQYSMKEYLYALQFKNIPMLLEMEQAGYPKFISNHYFLCEVLYRLQDLLMRQDCNTLVIASRVFRTLMRNSKSPRLTVVQGVQFMCAFEQFRREICEITDWSDLSDYDETQNQLTPLLFNFGVLSRLFLENKLAQFASQVVIRATKFEVRCYNMCTACQIKVLIADDVNSIKK